MTARHRSFSAEQRPIDTPFDVRERRVMLSLGPLSSGKYCTYSCPFCYVGGDFLSYASLPIDDIVAWVAALTEPFDVIFVSCDTDSFAPPREAAAMELLERLAKFRVDLLLTTRAVLSQDSVTRMKRVAEDLRCHNRMLIGCVSLVQVSVPHLEPKPIPPVAARIRQLALLREAGLRTVLALRPFLPNVPLDDYPTLVSRCASTVDLVLGGVWYYDQRGTMVDAVLGKVADNPSAIPHATRPMHFDTNPAEWHVFEGRDAETVVRAACEKHDIPMFMRSAPAIEWLRTHPQPLIEATDA
jgi:DNA repair photolyase